MCLYAQILPALQAHPQVMPTCQAFSLLPQSLVVLSLLPTMAEGRVDESCTPDTYHSGLGPIVGLHDGETQWRDPLHCLS